MTITIPLEVKKRVSATATSSGNSTSCTTATGTSVARAPATYAATFESVSVSPSSLSFPTTRTRQQRKSNNNNFCIARTCLVLCIFVIFVLLQLVGSTNNVLSLLVSSSSSSSIEMNRQGVVSTEKEKKMEREEWATIPPTIITTKTTTAIFTRKQQKQRLQDEQEQQESPQLLNNNNNNNDDDNTIPLPSLIPMSTSSYTWNDKGSMEWPRELQQQQQQRLLQRVLPTGMVVTIVRQTKQEGTISQKDVENLMDLLCKKIPTQQAYFLEPHGIDLLLLLDIEDESDHYYYYDHIVECLELVPKPNNPNYHIKNYNNNNNNNNQKTWINMDNSTMTTFAYTRKNSENGTTTTRTTTIYLAPNYVMSYPDYIQRNMSILDEPMWDCPFPTDYIQGTRYYTDQFLHLSILQEYEYMIKMDLDIEFKQQIPFNILWDMKQRGVLLGHTAEFPPGGISCTKGIRPVMESFVRQYKPTPSTTSINTNADDPTLGTAAAAGGTNDGTTSWTHHWKGPCSAGVKEFERGKNQYYSNFIIMNREFFQSAPVRSYGRWMNEYNPGYFKYRWGDQLFFHIAMGMFLGPDFRKYVWDYTHLRCRRFPNCWYHFAGGGVNERNFCQTPGGVFAHGKALHKFGVFNWSKVPASIASPMIDMADLDKNHVDWYYHNCKNLEAQEANLTVLTERFHKRTTIWSKRGTE